MGGISEFFIVVNVAGMIANLASAAGIFYLCAILKRGFDEHICTMRVIYEEIESVRRAAKTPVAPHDSD